MVVLSRRQAPDVVVTAQKSHVGQQRPCHERERQEGGDQHAWSRSEVGRHTVGLKRRKSEGSIGGQERGARRSRLDRTQGELLQGEDVRWSPNLHICVH